MLDSTNVRAPQQDTQGLQNGRVRESAHQDQLSRNATPLHSEVTKGNIIAQLSAEAGGKRKGLVCPHVVPS